MCKEAKDQYAAAIAADNTSPSVDFAHYSFDFAQQVHLPSDPLQPGPIYFLTPRKCALFGVCCEAIPRQVRTVAAEKVINNNFVLFRSTTSLTREWLLAREPIP